MEHVELLDRNCWLVSDYSCIWRTEDAGATFSRVYSSASNDPDGKIGGLTFADNQNGFIIDGRTLLRTTDGGKTWEAAGQIGTAEEESFFKSCHFVDLDHGWAVGAVWSEGWVHNPSVPAFAGAVFATADGGKTWRRQELKAPEGFFEPSERWYLRDVFFLDHTVGWSVGRGVIFWTADGGETWNLARSPRNGDYGGVMFLDEMHGWATEREGPGLAVTVDGGRKWRMLKGPPRWGTLPAHAHFLSPTRGFATLVSLYETNDGGQSWQWRAGSNRSPGPAFDYLGVARDGTVVALGLDLGEVNALISTDNGLNWSSRR